MKVLLTCATSGIGEAIVKHVPGIDWVLASRSGQGHMPLDFDSPDNYKVLAQSIGPLDGVVLIPPRVPPPGRLFPELEEWNEFFFKSFFSPMSFLKETLAAQTFEGVLKIVVIGGISSVCAMPNYGSANAMRLAWLGQTKSISLALGPRGVRINTLSLGAVLTDVYREKLKIKAKDANRTFEEQMSIETSNVPTGQYSTGEDVSNAVEALLGPMTDQMTGQNFLMDGGFFRGY